MSSTPLATAGRVSAVTLDQFDITGFYNEYKFKRDAALIDVTPFGNRVSSDLAGIQKAGLELKGFYNSTHDVAIHQRFGQDEDVLLALAPQGYKPLAPVVMLPSVTVKYDVSAKAKDAVTVDSEFALRGFVDNGVQLFSPKTILTAASGVSGIYDNGSSATSGATVAGWASQLHVWAIGGTSPSVTVTIEDSADGTAFATLGAFTTAIAPESDRLEVDFGNTVRRYVRARYVLVGGGAVQMLTGFARSVDYS